MTDVVEPRSGVSLSPAGRGKRAERSRERGVKVSPVRRKERGLRISRGPSPGRLRDHPLPAGE
ncbi:MAG TPA: hypothetical protein VNM92_02225, partial [Thermoanaerobaculia bacterium]|nr:hypothetical protein [Thermoanaerobaculia bacterium]